MQHESETLRMICPNLGCTKVLSVPASARGRLVRCRNCSTMIRIPDRRADTERPRDQSGTEGRAA